MSGAGTVTMSMTDVITRTMRPITVRPGNEPDWSPFKAGGCIFFRYKDQMLPYLAGDLGAIHYSTLADAFGLRPDSIRINGRRYKPAQKPNGFICLTNPAQYRQKLYQNPEQPAVVTGEPAVNLLRCAKGVISSLFPTAADDTPGNTSQQSSEKRGWFHKGASTSDETTPLVANYQRV